MAATHPSRVVIRTARLELVPLEVESAHALVETGIVPGRRRAEGYPTDSTLVAAGIVVTAAAEGRALGPFTTYQVVRKSDRSVVGDVGFHAPPDDHGSTTVGYSIADSARGRGYAAEALEALIGFAMLQPGVRHVVADTTRSNRASRRVMEKAGMRLVRTEDELLIYEA